MNKKHKMIKSKSLIVCLLISVICAMCLIVGCGESSEEDKSTDNSASKEQMTTENSISQEQTTTQEATSKEEVTTENSSEKETTEESSSEGTTTEEETSTEETTTEEATTEKPTVESLKTVEEIRKCLVENKWYSKLEEGEDSLFYYFYDEVVFRADGTMSENGYRNLREDISGEIGNWSVTDDKKLVVYDEDSSRSIEWTWGDVESGEAYKWKLTKDTLMLTNDDGSIKKYSIVQPKFPEFTDVFETDYNELKNQLINNVWWTDRNDTVYEFFDNGTLVGTGYDDNGNKQIENGTWSLSSDCVLQINIDGSENMSFNLLTFEACKNKKGDFSYYYPYWWLESNGNLRAGDLIDVYRMDENFSNTSEFKWFLVERVESFIKGVGDERFYAEKLLSERDNDLLEEPFITIKNSEIAYRDCEGNRVIITLESGQEYEFEVEVDKLTNKLNKIKHVQPSNPYSTDAELLHEYFNGILSAINNTVDGCNLCKDKDLATIFKMDNAFANKLKSYIKKDYEFTSAKFKGATLANIVFNGDSTYPSLTLIKNGNSLTYTFFDYYGRYYKNKEVKNALEAYSKEAADYTDIAIDYIDEDDIPEMIVYYYDYDYGMFSNIIYSYKNEKLIKLELGGNIKGIVRKGNEIKLGVQVYVTDEDGSTYRDESIEICCIKDGAIKNVSAASTDDKFETVRYNKDLKNAIQNNLYR